uniref:Uncharacterized protein n=2 Tax=Pseudomonas TaxID=286 RepID=A0A7S5YDR5_PSEAI|nr:hypothetical protein [Pseudomonas monteilii]QLG04993.1 hypothetical protein [Pseudomonas aeruginosa]
MPSYLLMGYGRFAVGSKTWPQEVQAPVAPALDWADQYAGP